MSSRYTPIAELLPAVFQNDAESFDQIDSYLSLVDDVQRGYLDRLEQLDLWLSPNGPRSAWPLGLPLDAGADRVIDAYGELYDELAGWTAFVFPSWWSVGEGAGRRIDLERRRNYLARAARFWRRRGTPRGLMDWICFAFGIEDDVRPWFLEHFKYGRPEIPEEQDVEPGPEPWLRATLLVPSTPQFDQPEMRRILMRFVETYAPAHVHVRVCFVDLAFELYETDSGVQDLPGPRPRPDDELGLAAWRADVDDFREHVRSLLCALGGNTSHESAMTISNCIDDGEAKDRLGVGRLPGGGLFVGDSPDSGPVVGPA